MRDLLDLDRYPLDRADSATWARLTRECQARLLEEGMFNLEGFVRPETVAQAVTQTAPLFSTEAYTHQRAHNVYFKDEVPGVPADHPALARFDTVNHTLCGDQLIGTVIETIYEWQPLRNFLAAVMGKASLYTMQDPLARFNAMEYRDGETLNWHFDRAQYTTTLLLQAAEAGGNFEYRSRLRSDQDPNYAGVGRVLAGEDDSIRVNPLAAGTLNVFAGRDTLHRVSAVRGTRARIVAVFSYYDSPAVSFSDRERLGFYGRTA